MPDEVPTSLSRRIADGEAIDWAAASADESVDADLLEALQLIERLSRAHREAADLLDTSSDGGVRERWGHLEILEQLGSGSFGQVFRARDRLLDREVALKLLDEPNLEEGRLLAQIRHPNIVTVYGYDVQNGQAGLWMELVEGRDLAEIVEADGPLGAVEAVETVVEVCGALTAVHAAGILHRDVKAQNVMREAGGRIVLTDFGIGRRVTDTGQPAVLSGTPVYLAPEVLRGETSSPRSEVYSVGVLLFYLLAGRFPVEARTVEELLARHEDGTLNRLSDLRPELPTDLLTTIGRALDPDAEGRFATVVDLEEALCHLLPAGTPVPDPPVESRRAWRRAVAAVALGALALGLAWLLLGSGRTAASGAGAAAEAGATLVSPPSSGGPLGSVLDMAQFGGKSYLLVGAADGSGINWTDSEAFAQTLGGHLVTIDDQNEQDFLAARWGDRPDTPYDPYALWIGLRDDDGSNVFDTWVDGTPVGYTHFHPREPDQDTEDYIAMMVDWGGCGKSSAGNPWFNTPNHVSNSCGLGKHYYGIVELPTSAIRTAPLGIVAWWPGDPEGMDIVGSNDAVLRNTVVVPDGRVGAAYGFVDEDARLEIRDHLSLHVQELSIEGWFYLATDEPRTLLTKPIETGGLSSFSLSTDRGLRATISDGTAAVLDVDSGVPPPVGRFFHLALTWDGDSGKLYLDGDFIAALDPPSFEVAYSKAPVFASTGPGGRIDELTIYDRALSRREVAHIYSLGSEGKWRDLDGDGVADALDRCPESQPDESVDSSGCSSLEARARTRESEDSTTQENRGRGESGSGSQMRRGALRGRDL